MDQVLTREQRQNLIQLICYADGDTRVSRDNSIVWRNDEFVSIQRLSTLSSNPQKYVANMLSAVTRWTLRQRLLELQVMLRESGQEKSLPEQIARYFV